MIHLLTLTWNKADKLERLKHSLIPVLNNFDYQWLIKDNNSIDNTEDVVKSWDNNNINYIKYPNNNQNFSAGMNFLFNESNAKDNDYILLLNNDVVFNDLNSLRNMVNLFNKVPNAGVVGAKLLFTNTNKLQHAGVVFDNYMKMPLHFRSHQDDDKFSSKNREFQAVTGAVLLTKASIFKEVCTDNQSGINGMDENFHWAFDDIDFCLSVKYKLKKKILYCGQTNIFHDESDSLKLNPVNKLFMNHNKQYLLQKWKNKFQLDKNAYIQNNKLNLIK